MQCWCVLVCYKYRPSAAAAAACKGVRRSTCLCGMHVCILCDSSRLPLRCLSFFFFCPDVLPSLVYFRSAAPFACCAVRSMMPWTTDCWPPPATKRPWNWMCTALKPLTFWRPTTCWPRRKVRRISREDFLSSLIYSSQHKYAIRSLFKELSASTTKCWFYCVLPTEKDFLDSLPLSQQCTQEEEELLHFLFENKLKKVGLWC